MPSTSLDPVPLNDTAWYSALDVNDAVGGGALTTVTPALKGVLVWPVRVGHRKRHRGRAGRTVRVARVRTRARSAVAEVPGVRRDRSRHGRRTRAVERHRPVDTLEVNEAVGAGAVTTVTPVLNGALGLPSLSVTVRLTV